MARIKRRQFLQAAGATLAALGWNQFQVANLGDRYGKVLAQETPRKLALLVGINQYADPSVPPLAGCVTDTELQYRLLVHRFGFNPRDIVVLTDQQANREGILTAFEEHLIKQAKPGDVVAFHFSGHGSRVVDPDRDHPDGLNSTLVPSDAMFPANFPAQSGSINDITGHSLFLLMSALQTENVTMVLDSCHSGGGTRGNLQVRARAGGGQLQMSTDELAYQEQWLSKLDLTPEAFIEQRRKGIAQGVAIASAKRDQFAADYPFEDFFAGAFTYTLTQYLWQQPTDEPFNSAIPNVARSTTQIYSGQEPQIESQPNRTHSTQPVYFLSKQTPPAEAVITKVEGNEAEVWLGGVDPNSLETFRRDAILSAVNAQGETQGLLKLIQRQGLSGRGQLLQPIESGALLQEQTRTIPQDASLRIGLAASLGDQSAAASQALSALNRVEALPLQQGEVHYILGRFTGNQPIVVPAGTSTPVNNSLGLFSQGLEVIPGSFGIADESVTDGIERLQAKLRSLLAARLVKLALNPSSSRLNLGVTMTPAGQGQIVASSFTVRGSTATAPPPVRPGVQQLTTGTAIEFQIENRESQDLHLSILVIDASGNMSVIFPNQWTATSDATLLSAGEQLRLPDPNRDGFQLVTQDPKGTTEVLVVASTEPLDAALRSLQSLAAEANQSRGPVGLTEPDVVVNDLLQDLTTRGGEAAETTATLDASKLAALSITFDVI